MLVIVDNGKGSSEIASLIRMKKEIVPPSKLKSVNGSAYILTDGEIKNSSANAKLIKTLNIPVLGIGAGSLFLCSAFGAKINQTKAEKKKTIKITKSCPLLLDFKKIFSVSDDCNHVIDELPDVYDIAASSEKYEFEIFQGIELPFFGIHFNLNDMEGARILHNFEKFVDVWGKYHRQTDDKH